MKLFLSSIILIMSSVVLAEIPTGTYKVDKIQCKTGYALKLGGKFMEYAVYLDVRSTEMTMRVSAKAGSWAPFRLNCSQENKGRIVYTAENKYEGDLPMTKAKCNAETWTNIIKKKQFGVEAYGEFNYKVAGKKLMIWNPSTINKYKCTKSGDYPIYYYSKQ
jgi:hypothetical protein